MPENIINETGPVEILDRTIPPRSGIPKDINFPKFFETKTDNGITILVIEDKRLPLVTTRFVFNTGSYRDYFAGENKSGLASMTSELLIKGTTKRNATQIAEEVDYLGASLSSGSDYDATYISSYSLKKYFNDVFDIISDVTLNPSFEEDEINRLAEQRINSLLTLIDDGDYLSDRIFKEIVHKNTPYELPPEGTGESIKSLKREEIISFYKKTFTPDNLIVAFVGDITPDEAIKKMNEKLSHWKNDPVSKTKVLKADEIDRTKIYLIEKKGAVQSSIKAGHVGISRDNADFIAVNVMNTMLGGYFTSRINKNLREENGYTYGARSHFYSYKYSGDFSVTTEVKNDITSNTITEILKELKAIRNDFVTDDELQNVKNYISGSFPLQLETPNAIASKAINLKIHNLDADYYNTYIRKVNALTKEQIKEIANKYIHPERLTISVAGNVDEIKDAMEQFGEVEIVKDLF